MELIACKTCQSSISAWQLRSCILEEIPLAGQVCERTAGYIDHGPSHTSLSEDFQAIGNSYATNVFLLIQFEWSWQAAQQVEDESARFASIPEKLASQLMAFQAEGVKFALRHGGRALIGDELRARLLHTLCHDILLCMCCIIT